jgi:hypothetical protein
MSTEFRTRNATALAVVQSAQGTEGSPTPANNAVRVTAPVGFSPAFEMVDTDFVQASISRTPPVVGGGRVSMKLSTFLSPSSTAGATRDPDYGVLLRGCSTQEVKTSADVTGASAAITPFTITLAGSASGVDNAYLGMAIEGTSASINGQRQVITGYVGSTKVATVYPGWTGATGTPSYAIRKNSLYVPITTAPSYLTVWGYQHSSVSGNNSRRRRLMDGMGTAQISVKAREPAKIDFTFTGVLPAVPDDVAKPAAPSYLGLDPQVLAGGSCFLGGNQFKFSDFSLDFGNTVDNFDDPNATYGYDSADILLRDVTGTITPNLVAASTRNTMSDWLSMNNQTLWICWGATGKGVSLLIPSLRWTDDQPDDASGFQVEKLKFATSGNDSEFYLCVF